MGKKAISNAKFVIDVESNKKTHEIKTISVFDNRIQEYLTEDYIQERNIKNFLDISDMKETLNWNLNGDDSKYVFKWGRSDKLTSEGRAYVFH